MLFEKPEPALHRQFLSANDILGDAGPEEVFRAFLAGQSAELSVKEKTGNDIRNLPYGQLFRVKQLLAQSRKSGTGLTFFSTRVEKHLPGLQSVIQSLSDHFFPRRFTTGISVSGSEAEISMHADDADVLVLQVTGGRTWKVLHRDEMPATFRHSVLAGRRRLAEAEEQKDAAETFFSLAPNDGLFIPALFPHAAVSAGENESPVISISLIGELLTWKTFATRHLGKNFRFKNELQAESTLISFDHYKDVRADERISFLFNELVKQGAFENADNL